MSIIYLENRLLFQKILHTEIAVDGMSIITDFDSGHEQW